MPTAFSERMVTFLTWAFWVGIAFFSIYPTTNWLASLRPGHPSLYFDSELSLPFVPELIWVYFSIYALFVLPLFILSPESLDRLGKEMLSGTIIAGILFLLLPAKLGFVRTLPDSDYYAIFYNLFLLDQPYNLVPSLHVVYCTEICISITAITRTWISGIIWAWLAAIIASTLLVHQHHVLDVVTGIALAVLLNKLSESNGRLQGVPD